MRHSHEREIRHTREISFSRRMFYVFLKKSDQRTQKWINSRQTLRDAFDAHFFFFFLFCVVAGQWPLAASGRWFEPHEAQPILLCHLFFFLGFSRARGKMCALFSSSSCAQVSIPHSLSLSETTLSLSPHSVARRRKRRRSETTTTRLYY